MKTELIIISSGTTYVSSGVIDLYDDMPISLNYNIADIKEPQSRNSDYSKTITVPGTNNNNNLLSNIYEIGIDRLFNPNHRTEARILVDKIQVMKGWLRLVKIRTLRNNKIEYDFEIKGRLDDLFTIIKDKKLTDLTWSDLDHTYNKTNIENSWSAAVGSNYVYPFIDFGSSPNPNDYSAGDFRPATYLKEIWDRIFSYAGFQYSSTFLTGNFFKRLIIPFTSDKFSLTETQVQNREFKASRVTTVQTFTSSSSTYTTVDIIFNDDSTSPNSDTGGNYNTATGVYIVPANGYYDFTASVDFSLNSGSGSPTGYIQIIRNTSNPILATSTSSILVFPANPITVTLTAATGSVYLVSGDQIKVQIRHHNLFSLTNVDMGINSFFQCKIITATLSLNNTIVYSSVLPQKIKMSELLISIIKMFNLYIEYDKDTPNKMFIEPRNDFYNSTVQDWSNKLAVEKEPEIMPMGALDAKRYLFQYKKDNDWLNTIYQDTYGQGTDSTYGERIIDVDNDFLKNDNKPDIIFSPTPLYSDLSSNRVFPYIVKVDPQTGAVSPITTNIRILYYGGLKTSTPSWNFYDNYPVAPSIETQYPYCGHLDDPDAPTIDLSFGVPKEIYYIPSWQATYTNNNIYNAYWRTFINEITDYNSSIVTAWFRLQPADILEVNFRHVYHFMNQNFRLNKIYDYNPIQEGITKCEFIKLKTGIPTVSRTAIITGGRNATISPL